MSDVLEPLSEYEFSEMVYLIRCRDQHAADGKWLSPAGWEQTWPARERRQLEGLWARRAALPAEPQPLTTRDGTELARLIHESYTPDAWSARTPEGTAALIEANRGRLAALKARVAITHLVHTPAAGSA